MMNRSFDMYCYSYFARATLTRMSASLAYEEAQTTLNAGVENFAFECFTPTMIWYG